jgi:ATP-dependent Lon protease
MSTTLNPNGPTVLVPVLPLRDVCLFPEASLATIAATIPALKAVEIAHRTGGQLLAVGQRDPDLTAWRDLHEIGTVADVGEDLQLPDASHRVELDGLRRARVLTVIASDVMVAEVQLLDDGDPGEYWGAAVESLARYMHAHSELRSFLELQRRSAEPMSWVNLACQHLPITASARQKLLESPAADRCMRIARGLDALLRKEQGG